MPGSRGSSGFAGRRRRPCGFPGRNSRGKSCLLHVHGGPRTAQNALLTPRRHPGCLYGSRADPGPIAGSVKFHSLTVRAIVRDGELWFVAKDVCAALGLSNVGQTLSKLDDDERNTVILNDRIRGNPNRAIVSESGLYAITLRSDKPEAKEFKRWVTGEVLPTICKTGMFMTQETAKEAVESPEQFLARALVLAGWRERFAGTAGTGGTHREFSGRHQTAQGATSGHGQGVSAYRGLDGPRGAQRLMPGSRGEFWIRGRAKEAMRISREKIKGQVLPPAWPAGGAGRSLDDRATQGACAGLASILGRMRASLGLVAKKVEAAHFRE